MKYMIIDIWFNLQNYFLTESRIYVLLQLSLNANVIIVNDGGASTHQLVQSTSFEQSSDRVSNQCTILPFYFCIIYSY